MGTDFFLTIVPYNLLFTLEEGICYETVFALLLAATMAVGSSVTAFAAAPAGDLFRAYLNTKDGVDGGITIDILNFEYDEELKMELYSGSELFTYKVLNRPAPQSGAEVTCTFSTEEAYREGSWLHQPYIPYDEKVPTEVSW